MSHSNEHLQITITFLRKIEAQDQRIKDLENDCGRWKMHTRALLHRLTLNGFEDCEEMDHAKYDLAKED